MAKLRDVLQYIAYGTALDIVEIGSYCTHLFSVNDLITRECIEVSYTQYLDRELKSGIHAEGSREGCLVIPLKPLE